MKGDTWVLLNIKGVKQYISLQTQKMKFVSKYDKNNSFTTNLTTIIINSMF